MAFGSFVHWGFFNFALGLPLFLFFAATWRRLDGRRDATAFGLTALFMLALTLTHVTTVVAACLLLAADGVERAAEAARRSSGREALRGFLRDGIWALMAALPSLLLIASFLTAYQGIEAPPPSYDGGLAQVARRIVTASYLYSFSKWEVAALATLLAATAFTGFVAARRLGRASLVWPIFLVLVVVLSAFNLKTGYALLSERLAPYTWLGLVLTIAGRLPGPAQVRLACLAAAIGLCGQTAMRVVAYRSWSPVLESTLALGRAHPGATFASTDGLTMDTAPFAWRVRPTLHASQIAAVAAGGVGMSSPLPSRRYFGYFPLQYRDGHDFMKATRDWEADPDPAEAAAFRALNAGAPGVLIVAGPEGSLHERAARLGYPDCADGTTSGRVAACTGAQADPLAVQAR